MPFPDNVPKRVRITMTRKGDSIVASLSLSNPKKRGEEALDTDGRTHGTVVRRKFEMRLGQSAPVAFENIACVMATHVLDAVDRACAPC
jgi:hypothetical protein